MSDFNKLDSDGGLDGVACDGMIETDAGECLHFNYYDNERGLTLKSVYFGDETEPLIDLAGKSQITIRHSKSDNFFKNVAVLEKLLATVFNAGYEQAMEKAHNIVL